MEKKTVVKSKKKESKPKEEQDSQWQFKFLIDQFSKESDRAAVILVASIIDENLGTLLKSYLVPNPSSSDSLFDSATSPLSNFSSKIDLCFRIGIISGKLTRDLHIIRKIRNSFAHDIYGCSFENGSVRSRIRELENSVSNKWINQMSEVKRSDDLLEGTRGKFIFITGAIIWEITDKISEIKELKESEIEWFYIDSKEPSA